MRRRAGTVHFITYSDLENCLVFFCRRASSEAQFYMHFPGNNFSRVSIVCIVIRLSAGWSGVRILAKATDCFFSPKLEPAILLLNGLQRSFLGVKRPGSDGDHSHPFGTDFKSYWSYISTPRICRHVVNRVNFIFAVLAIHNLYL
jgi:hypothetical protein